MESIQDVIGLFDEYADLSEDVQKRIIEIDNKPDRRKQLRKFSAREAAKALGISDSYLRRLVLEEQALPNGKDQSEGKRSFTLREIRRIREWLLEKTDDNRYRTKRSGEEKLQVISFCNFKGGAAKTTSSVHFAQYLALRGYRVLLIDLDSQASATGWFGFSPDEEVEDVETLYGFMRGEIDSLASIVRKTYWDQLDIIPANLGLYRVEFELPVRQIGEQNFRFWRLLQDGIATVADGYDVVICDAPPSLGYLSINAIVAATGMVIPAPPSMLDFASTGRFFRMMSETLADIIEFEGPGIVELDFVKILTSRFNTSDVNHRRIAGWMMANFGDALLENRMAVTTALDMAGNVKRTLYELEPGTRRKSLERGKDYLNAVNQELEGMLLQTWQRPQPVSHLDETGI